MFSVFLSGLVVGTFALDQTLLSLFRAFGNELKKVCDTDWVHVDETGVAVRFESVFLSGNVEHIVIAPISAMHQCGSVRGSLYLREKAVAFYVPFMQTPLVKQRDLKAVGHVRKILERGHKDHCSFIDEFDALVNLLTLVKRSFHPLHEFYVLGFIHQTVNGHCKSNEQVTRLLREYLVTQASKKVRYDRVSRAMTHNFFKQVDSIAYPSNSNRVFLLQLLSQSFPAIVVPGEPAQGGEVAPVVREMNPLTGVPLAKGKTLGMQFRLMVVNDGKLAKDGMIFNYMMQFAKDRKTDFVVISEGTVGNKATMDTIAAGHGFKVMLPTKTGVSLAGGVGLAYRTGLQRYTSQAQAPTATGFDVGVLGIDDGVRLAALYTSPSDVDSKGRAIKALKHWSAVASALMWRTQLSLEHESIVAGDMNAASGTYQRLVFDAGMKAMDFHLLNEGLVTFLKSEKDIDLIYATAGVSVMGDFEISRSARVNDHSRVLGDITVRERREVELFTFQSIDLDSLEEVECHTFSCLLKEAAVDKTVMQPYALATAHVVDNFRTKPEALRGRRRAGQWAGRVFSTTQVIWPTKMFYSIFSYEDVSNAVDWMFSDCLSCHQLPDLPDKVHLKTLLVTSLEDSFRSGYMVDELAAPVLERLLAVSLKNVFNNMEDNPLDWEGVRGCSSWSGRHLEDEDEELTLSLLVRVLTEEAIAAKILATGKPAREFFVASVNFDQRSLPTDEALEYLIEKFPDDAGLSKLFRLLRTFVASYKANSYSLVRNLGCLAMAKAMTEISDGRDKYSITVKKDAFAVSDAIWANGIVMFGTTPTEMKSKLNLLQQKLKLRAHQVDIMSYPGVVAVDIEFDGERHVPSSSLRLPFGIHMLQANARSLMISKGGPESVIYQWQMRRMFLSDQEAPLKDDSARFIYLVNEVISDSIKGAEVSLQPASSYAFYANMVAASIPNKSFHEKDVVVDGKVKKVISNFADLDIICASSIKGHPAYKIAKRIARLLLLAKDHALHGPLFKALLRRQGDKFESREGKIQKKIAKNLKPEISIDRSNMKFFDRVFTDLFKPITGNLNWLMTGNASVQDRLREFEELLVWFYSTAIPEKMKPGSVCVGNGVRNLQAFDEVKKVESDSSRYESFHAI